MGRAKIIAIANPKGGVGKTTIAVNLAHILARDAKVLVCDLDGSCNLSRFIPFYDADYMSVKDLLEGAFYVGPDRKKIPYSAEDIIIHGDGNLDLLCSEKDMMELDVKLSNMDKEKKYMLLRDKLASVADMYDYCVLDSPANDRLAYKMSLSIPGVYLLVPMLASRVSYDALAPIFEAFAEIQGKINPDVRFAGVIMNQADARLSAYQYLTETLESQLIGAGAKLFKTSIRNAKGPIENAGLSRLPVVVADPNSKVSKDFESLAIELKERIAEMEEEANGNIED